ncbi:hypothetical protein FOZ60_004923 [Perkinsus olseni]|uniref:C3H1-type domain-containing protein n=1 Tax=Perkinsus olseni TaxID=32597 RepID=A0A7J6NS63_PEROL|nr:hypothetical protein FOZ60_004923 [Perkinsus olseni]
MKWVPPSVEHGDSELYLAANSPLRPASSSSSGVTKEHFYKTKLCVFYALQGRCIHGNNCTYAHGMDDLVSTDGLLVSPPLPSGNCRLAGSTGNETEIYSDLPPRLGLADIHEGEDQYGSRRFRRRQSPRSSKTPRSGRDGRRALRRARPKPSTGRPWNAPQIQGLLPAEDLLIGSRSTLGEESLLSHTSAYPTGNGELTGSYMHELFPGREEGSPAAADNAELSRGGHVTSEFLVEVLQLLDDCPMPR